jgi:hypothetical protein
MYWAQYYDLRQRADGSKHYVEAVGSDQLAHLDGRLSSPNMERVAREIGTRRGYDGFRVYRGPRYTQGHAMMAAVRPL